MYTYDEIKEISLNAIELINSYGIKCSVLTKGILPIELSNWDRFSEDNEYGITLISLDKIFCESIEPGAAPIEERIASLKALHNNNRRTWVSIEPYPTPNIIDQDLTAILNAVSFTNKIIFGKMNYNKKVSEYKGYKEFYNKCASDVICFCNKRNITFHIKNKTINADYYKA